MQRPGEAGVFQGLGQTGAGGHPYGVNTGYQSAAPVSKLQWAPLAQNNNAGATLAQQQWNQAAQQGSWNQQSQQPPQQTTGGYNPGTYGAMPGGYGQTQQQDQPPPPPPKPQGYPATMQPPPVQQGTQNWGQTAQQPPYGPAPNAGNATYPQGQQGGSSQQQQPNFQNTVQQPYNNAAPPPPSQTPGGSYFPPAQARPQSMYAADQAGTYSTPQSAAAQQPPNTVMSPNEQNPAYVPPSLSGQGVTSYMPTNTNPMPGVYVPPPPDIPAWQPATHAPLQQDTKKFRYTKPSVDPSFYAQGYRPPQQPQFTQQQMQYAQHPVHQSQQPYGQPAQTDQFQHQGQMQAGPFVSPSQPIQQQLGPTVQGEQIQQPTQQFQKQGQHWQLTPQIQPLGQGLQQPQAASAQYSTDQPVPQQPWQPGHQAQGSMVTSQLQDIPAPKPLGRTGTAPPDFVNQSTIESQPVSPISSRKDTAFGPGRTDSISSIALDAIRNQQAQSAGKTTSPAPSLKQQVATPPPLAPAGPNARFSALGTGGPSDWEHFANVDEEIDDEALFAKKENKDITGEPKGVELPASVPEPISKPPSTADWPTPLSQAAQPVQGPQDQDAYQPTPPLKPSTPAQSLPSQPPQQTSVMSDVVVPSKSPQPSQMSQPPPAQQSFVVDDGGCVPPKQSTPARGQQQSPPASQTFVMDDGGWAVQRSQPPPVDSQARQSTPLQTQQQQTAPSTSFVMADAVRAAEQTPTQPSSKWDAQVSNDQHAAALKGKDDAYELLKADIEKMKLDTEAAKNDAEKMIADSEKYKAALRSEINRLTEELKSVKAQSTDVQIRIDKARSDHEALLEEKDATIERLKEDGEGKDDIVKEKDAAIRERDATIMELRQHLEAERAKEIPTPRAADLVPDIDPWYVGSLERYIAMLKSEYGEPKVEEKIKIFTAFLENESAVRGLPYFSCAPPAPAAPGTPAPVTAAPVVVESVVATLSQDAASSQDSLTLGPSCKPDVHVKVPEQLSANDDPAEYSPGGRPILRRVQTLKSDESIPTQKSFATPTGQDQAPPLSAQSTTILTPASSVDEDFNKTPTPMHSPPEEQPQPQYKAYVPPASAPIIIDASHRQSMAFAAPVSMTPVKPKNEHDEIFFSEPQPAPKPTSRTISSHCVLSEETPVPIPAPLSFNKPKSPAPPTPQPAKQKKATLAALAALVPPCAIPMPTGKTHPTLQAILDRVCALPSSTPSLTSLTAEWEKSASAKRKELDAARQARQEETEQSNEELYNAEEISYQEWKRLENELKEEEAKLKAQEEKEEYKGFVESVFDIVFGGAHEGVKEGMEGLFDVERIAHLSVKDGNGGEWPSTMECLRALKEAHDVVETLHEQVAEAVKRRDKRYKKTELAPLYAAGNITKMKAVETHFANAEKQAVVRALGERAGRLGCLVTMCDAIVREGVAAEQGRYATILDALRDLSDGGGEDDEHERRDALTRTKHELDRIKLSSKETLTFFNGLEIDLARAVMQADLAKARADGMDTARVTDIESKGAETVRVLKDDLASRLAVLEEDGEEVAGLLREKGLGTAGAAGNAVDPDGQAPSGAVSAEEERRMRLEAALLEAKRRNGHV